MRSAPARSSSSTITGSSPWRRAATSFTWVRAISTPRTCRRCAARNVRIGISTHDDAELARALGLAPDYIALGPIYPTLLKVMAFAPQGLERIGEWKRRIGAIPLVAIGGITLERLPGVLAAGADSAAVVTDIVRNPLPEERMRNWVHQGALA